MPSHQVIDGFQKVGYKMKSVRSQITGRPIKTDYNTCEIKPDYLVLQVGLARNILNVKYGFIALICHQVIETG